MKNILTLVSILLVTLQAVSAQTKTWSLQDCLDYALENNISLQQTRNSYLSGLEDTKEAKASLLPTVSASVSQGLSNYPSADPANNYSGSYGLNAGLTLWNGGRLRNSLKASRVQNSIDSLSLASSMIDIRISIVQAYIQCLYAKESITVNEGTVESSKATMDRAEEMWKAGSVSKVDYAQLQSQYYSDLYQLTSSQTSYDNYLLTLKQLLELDILDEIALDNMEVTEDEVLALLPPKSDVYANALTAMPEIASSELSIEYSELSLKQARSGYSPTLSASAGVSTSNGNHMGKSFGDQISDNFNENVGLSLSIPIFSGRSNKTAVNKAKINIENARLQQLDAEKSVLKDVEGTYLDVLSAQSQYIAARQNEEYAAQSYELTVEQFGQGIKNSVDLITAKNDYVSAQLSLLQSKYTAYMNIKILDILQGKI